MAVAIDPRRARIRDNIRNRAIVVALLGIGAVIKLNEVSENNRPAEQLAFLNFNRRAAVDWNSAANEIMQRRVFERVMTERCNLNFLIENWIATVKNVGEFNSKDASLAVEIGEDITFRTGGSFAGNKERIAFGSPFYETVAQLRAGEKIMISGSISKDENGCLKEASITKEGSITQPEYIFKFTSVMPQK